LGAVKLWHILLVRSFKIRFNSRLFVPILRRRWRRHVSLQHGLPVHGLLRHDVHHRKLWFIRRKLHRIIRRRKSSSVSVSDAGVRVRVLRRLRLGVAVGGIHHRRDDVSNGSAPPASSRNGEPVFEKSFSIEKKQLRNAKIYQIV